LAFVYLFQGKKRIAGIAPPVNGRGGLPERGRKNNQRPSGEMMPRVISALLFSERIGKYTIRPLLSLERFSLDERTGRVGYGLTSLLAEIYTLPGWKKG
jgi:hypothetical protein